MAPLAVAEHVYLAEVRARKVGQLGAEAPDVAEGCGRLTLRTREGGVEGNLKQRGAIAAEHACDLGEGLLEVDDLLDHVLGHDELHRFIGEGLQVTEVQLVIHEAGVAGIDGIAPQRLVDAGVLPAACTQVVTEDARAERPDLERTAPLTVLEQSSLRARELAVALE